MFQLRNAFNKILLGSAVATMPWISQLLARGAKRSPEEKKPYQPQSDVCDLDLHTIAIHPSDSLPLLKFDKPPRDKDRDNDKYGAGCVEDALAENTKAVHVSRPTCLLHFFFFFFNVQQRKSFFLARCLWFAVKQAKGTNRIPITHQRNLNDHAFLSPSRLWRTHPPQKEQPREKKSHEQTLPEGEAELLNEKLWRPHLPQEKKSQKQRILRRLLSEEDQLTQPEEEKSQEQPDAGHRGEDAGQPIWIELLPQLNEKLWRPLLQPHEENSQEQLLVDRLTQPEPARESDHQTQRGYRTLFEIAPMVIPMSMSVEELLQLRRQEMGRQPLEITETQFSELLRSLDNLPSLWRNLSNGVNHGSTLDLEELALVGALANLSLEGREKLAGILKRSDRIKDGLSHLFGTEFEGHL